MPYEIFITDAAADDIIEGIKYYNSKVEDLGFRFSDDVEDNVNTILITPLGFTVKYNDVRGKLLDTFPYVIFYRVLNEQIQILRVFNTHKDPFWM